MTSKQTLLKASGNSDVMESEAELSTSNGDTISMKVTAFDLDVRTPSIDATQETLASMGSGYSDNSIALYTGKITGSAKFQGYIINGVPLGFQNLPDEKLDVSICIGIISVASSAGQKHRIKFRLAVEAIQMKWARTNVGIPVTIAGKISGIFGSDETGGHPIAETIAS